MMLGFVGAMVMMADMMVAIVVVMVGIFVVLIVGDILVPHGMVVSIHRVVGMLTTYPMLFI